MKNQLTYISAIGTALLFLAPYTNTAEATSIPLHLRNQTKINSHGYSIEPPAYNFPLRIFEAIPLVPSELEKIQKILSEDEMIRSKRSSKR